MYYDMSYKLQYKITCIIYTFTELYIKIDIYVFGKNSDYDDNYDNNNKNDNETTEIIVTIKTSILIIVVITK